MYTINRINELTYSIEDEGVRFFLLLGESKGLVIDTGMKTSNALEIVRSITDLPLSLINTHCDIDHIAGNEDFNDIYLSQLEKDYYLTIRKNPCEIKVVSNDDIIDLGNRKIKVIELPGHTDGSIALLDIDNRALFGGDSIQDGRIFMFGKRRNIDKYIESLKMLWDNYQDEFDLIYACHSSLTVNKDIIVKLIDYATKIKNKEVTGNKINMMGQDITYYDGGFAGFLCE